MKYQVLINFSNKNYALDVTDLEDRFNKTSIRELKEKFRYRIPEAPDTEYVRVIYGKVPLEDDRALDFYQITHLSLLFFVSRRLGRGEHENPYRDLVKPHEELSNGHAPDFINTERHGLTKETTCDRNAEVNLLVRTDRFRDSLLRSRENLTESPEDELGRREHENPHRDSFQEHKQISECRASDYINTERHGLTNQGTTCYLNAVVQVLFRTDRFRDSVLRSRDNLTESPEDELLQALADVFWQLQRGHTAVSLEEVIEALNIRDVNEQKDAAEHLQIILHRLTEQAKIFCGILKTSIICSACRWKKESESEFLSIPLSNNAAGHCNAENALNRFLGVHMMRGDNQLSCVQCKLKRDMEMRNDIIKWPDILALQLKRLEMRSTRSFSLENERRVKIPPSIQTGLLNYELYAIINHYGSFRTGHYDAVIQDQSGNWNQFNDRDVTELGYSGHQWISDRSSSAYLLMYRGEPVSSSQMFKQKLKEKFQFLNKKNSLAEGKLMNEVFIEQLITEEPYSHSDKREIKSRNMFSIRTVLIKGDAGIGKTVTVQKLILDWAENKSHTDNKYIFPISFEKLNIINEMVKECSFMQILQQCFKHIEDFNPDSDNIMLIFDGLSEFKCALDFRNTKKITDINEPASVSTLLINLIMGNLLPDAQIWITTRPAAAQLIPAQFIDRVMEIHGFNDQQKEEYFRKNIRDQRMCDAVIRHIKSSRRINSMCYSPDYCRIIAAIPERIITTRPDDFPKTLTQMYSRLLLAQTEGIQNRRETIIDVERLALGLLVHGRTVFTDEDLKNHNIRDNYGLTRSSIIKKFGGKHRLFSFVNHRTLEFLAALYVTEVINRGKSFIHYNQGSLILEIREESFTDYNSLQQVKEMSLGKQMDLFFCFLLGLTLESSQRALETLLTKKSSSSFSHNTAQLIKTMIQRSPPDRCSLLLNALKELDEGCLIQEIEAQLTSELNPDRFSALLFGQSSPEHQPNWSDIRNLQPVVRLGQHELSSCHIMDSGCADLISALKLNLSHLRKLDLSGNTVGCPEAKQLSTLLADPRCKLEKLKLKLDTSETTRFFSALRSNPSHLRELDLSGSGLGDSGLKQLSDLLKHPQCKVQKLTLRSCHITHSGCADLSLALLLNPSLLKELDMSKCFIQDSGVENFSNLLKHSQCKLEKLRLQFCNIGAKGCAVLSSAHLSHLRELDLSGNVLGDLGVKEISDLLKETRCKLEKLWLSSCHITELGFADLISALSVSPFHLRELDISGNKITDSGVKQLSALLADPLSKLEILGLTLGNIRHAVLTSQKK